MTNKAPQGRRFLVSLAMLVASIAVVSWILRTQDLPMAARIAIALIPPACFVFYILSLAGAVTHLDEFQRRVHLDALAIAYPALGLAVFACEYLRKAGVINSLMPDHVLLMMMAILGLSYLVAWRRYQ
jgi:hypothetical protein